MQIDLSEKEKIKILNADDMYAIMQRILLRENKIDQNREHFWVVGLETNHRMLFIELVSLGSVKRAIAEPMEVFSFALQKRAVKIILVHNHPSGEVNPSENDMDITDRLIQVGLIVDTPVLDHFIISEKTYLSFKDEGLIDRLEQSTKFVPGYVLKERIVKQAMALADEKNERRLLDVAKKLKKQGIAPDIISKATNLSVKKIEAIKVKKG